MGQDLNNTLGNPSKYTQQYIRFNGPCDVIGAGGNRVVFDLIQPAYLRTSGNALTVLPNDATLGSQIVCNSPGLFQVNLCLQTNSSGSGVRVVRYNRQYGTTYVSYVNTQDEICQFECAAAGTKTCGSGIVELKSGDLIMVLLNVANALASVNLTVSKIGPAT